MKHEKVGVGEVDEWRGMSTIQSTCSRRNTCIFQYPDFEASQRIKKGAGFPIAERGSVRWEVVLQNFLNENIS